MNPLLNLFLHIFILISLLILTTQQCIDDLNPFQFSSDTSCVNPTKKLDKTWADFPSMLQTGSSSKILTFDAQFKLISTCFSSSSSIYTLFALQVDSAADPLVVLQFDQPGSQYVFTINVNGSPYSQYFSYIGSQALQPGGSVEILFSINLDTNDNVAFLILPQGEIRQTNPVVADFSSLEFNDQTAFVFCGDPTTLNPHAYCEILNLRTWYISYTDLASPFYNGDLYRNLFGNFTAKPFNLAVLQGYYEDQILNFILTDSVGGYGDATLGDGSGNFAPSWSNSAFEFATGTEYITLPSTVPNEAYRINSNSFTISFWIKPGEGTSSGVLFLRRSTSSSTDLTTIKLEADGTIIAQVLDSSSGAFPVQSSSSLPINTWTLLIVTFQTCTDNIMAYLSIYFGSVLQVSAITSTNPVNFATDDSVQIAGSLALDNPLYIARISYFSPGSNYVADQGSCSESCSVGIGAYAGDTNTCLFDLTPCHSSCETCSSPMLLPEDCLSCPSDRYLDNGYCVSNCFTYSDGSCLSTCTTPYTQRVETYTAYCDFKCDSSHYLYPNGSCLSTCPKPARSSPRTGVHYCKNPCDNSDYFYYPDLKTCQASCSINYLEDSSSTFYKQCILLPASTTTANVIKTSEKTSTVTKTVTQITSALSSGSPLGISASVAGKIFSNIKYLNITYSVELQIALLTWKSNFISLDFLPDMPLTLENKITNHPVPYMFKKYDVYSSFLVNFWENIVFLLILAALYLIARLIERALSKYSKLKTLRVMIQNFIITQLYSFYGDIVFFSTIEYRSLDVNEGLGATLSFFSSCILLVIMLICFIAHFILLRKYQQIKKQAQEADNMSALDQFIESKNGQDVLFRDFKDKSLTYQSFLLLLTARDLAFSLILTTLFNHPLLQTVIVLIMNIVMFVYLVLRPPLTSKFDGAQQLYYEFITLSVNGGVLILAILDAIDAVEIDFRTRIGRFIIIINMCFNFGALLFMLVGLGMLLREMYQEYRAKSRAKKHSKLPDTRPISPLPEREPKDLSLDDSHQQLVNTSFVVHPSLIRAKGFTNEPGIPKYPTRMSQTTNQKGFKNESEVQPTRIPQTNYSQGFKNQSEIPKYPTRISQTTNNFRLVKVDSPQKPPLINNRIYKKDYEPEPDPNIDFGSLTLNKVSSNASSNAELLSKKIFVRSSSIAISHHEMDEPYPNLKGQAQRGNSGENFGYVNRGIEREMQVEEGDFTKKGERGGNPGTREETKRKRIRRERKEKNN